MFINMFYKLKHTYFLIYHSLLCSDGGQKHTKINCTNKYKKMQKTLFEISWFSIYIIVIKYKMTTINYNLNNLRPNFRNTFLN